jgi:hypothetical protein
VVTEADMTELRSLCPDAKQAQEGGLRYMLLPSLKLPDGCTPAETDSLLCVDARDGYAGRLFFSQVIATREPRNWHMQNVRILERNWFAFSWQIPANLRPMEILLTLLRAVR